MNIIYKIFEVHTSLNTTPQFSEPNWAWNQYEEEIEALSVLRMNADKNKCYTIIKCYTYE
jgi:hypothetical protein